MQAVNNIFHLKLRMRVPSRIEYFIRSEKVFSNGIWNYVLFAGRLKQRNFLFETCFIYFSIYFLFSHSATIKYYFCKS